MPLPGSGAISLNQIHVEAGGSSGSQASLNDSDIRDLIGKGASSQNSFNEYYGISASQPTYTYLGRNTTTSNGFPSGYFTLSSGTYLYVYCMQNAGIDQANNNITLGGTAMTMAVKQTGVHPVASDISNGYVWGGNPGSVAIWYLVSSLSGSQYLTGVGGTGRSSGTLYEVSNYNSSTPYTTDTAQNTNADKTASITVSGQYNGLTFGVGMSEDAIAPNYITVSNADVLHQVNLESATAHCSWVDQATPSGNRTYTYTQASPGNNLGSLGTPINLCTASWK